MYHIISIKDFEREELDLILKKAEEIDSAGVAEHTLEGKLVALLFFEPSTRTRMSFASALARLGGTSITVDSVEGSSISKGETRGPASLTDSSGPLYNKTVHATGRD